MFQTKVKFADWQTPEQRKAHAAHWRRKDALVRKINNGLGFWRVCEKPLCRRNRNCLDNMHACFTRHWAMVPQEDREYWRGCVRATKTTRVPEELHRAGVAAREAYLQHLEQMTAQSMKPTPALPPRTSGPEPDARIRRL